MAESLYCVFDNCLSKRAVTSKGRPVKNGLCRRHANQKAQGEVLSEIVPKNRGSGQLWRQKDSLLPEGFKHCRKCGIPKPFENFSSASVKRSRDGLYSYCKLCSANKERLWKYKVSEEEVNKMYSNQGGICAICPATIERQNKKSHLDHNHITGVFRGLLCKSCNNGLGFFKDDIGILTSAIEYLKRTGT